MIKNGSQVSNREGVVRKILTCLLHATRERCERLKYWVLNTKISRWARSTARSNGQGGKNHVALNFSRVYILIPAAKSNLSLRSKRVAYSLPWLSLVRMSSHELIDAQFDRAVEIVQSLPKTGPIQTDYDEKLTMYRWGSLLRLFFWRPFLFYLQSI